MKTQTEIKTKLKKFIENKINFIVIDLSIEKIEVKVNLENRSQQKNSNFMTI